MIKTRLTGPKPLDATFTKLVESAFDFLSRAIEIVETDRKRSIIEFATAIELFLKARLFKEHWTLLCEKIDETDRAKFLSGSAKTVPPGKALKRLEAVGITVPRTTIDEFNRIAAHRNKAIHFFHEATTHDASEEALRVTIAEQFRGWNLLKDLLESWSDHFADFDSQMRIVSAKMVRHTEFLHVRFRYTACAARIAAIVESTAVSSTANSG